MAPDDAYRGGRFDEAAAKSAIADLQRRSGSGRTATVWPTLSLSLAVALSVSIGPNLHHFKGGIETIKLNGDAAVQHLRIRWPSPFP